MICTSETYTDACFKFDKFKNLLNKRGWILKLRQVLIL